MLRARKVLENARFKGDEVFGKQAVYKACGAPIRQIAYNAGKDGAIVERKVLANESSTFGYNALTDEFGDMLEFGVIDPAKVVVSALQNAVSVATLLLTTDALIAEKKEEEEGEEGHDYDMDEY